MHSGLLSFLFLLFALSLHAEQLKLQLSAKSAILINAESGAVLYEKEPDLRLSPASVTKIVTALYALERQGGDLDVLIEVDRESLRSVHAAERQAKNSLHPSYRLELDGTMMSILPGERVPFVSLLHGLMLRSGNDAANVIARHISGSIPLFVEEMNQFALLHGMVNTHFTNPHGLFHSEHYTTARDMATITRKALRHPLFAQVVKTVSWKRPKTNKQEEGVMEHTNRMLRPGKFHYPKTIGVKTGYIADAGNTYVSAAEHEGRQLIAVVLKCPKKEDAYRDTIALFEAAFAQKSASRILYTEAFDQFTTRVEGAKGGLRARLASDLELSYYPAEEPEYRAEFHWYERELPIRKGSLVGEIQITALDGKLLKRAALYAEADLERSLSSKLRQFLQRPPAKGSLLLLFAGVALYLVTRGRREGVKRRE